MATDMEQACCLDGKNEAAEVSGALEGTYSRVLMCNKQPLAGCRWTCGLK
jgi:hypothetical protein